MNKLRGNFARIPAATVVALLIPVCLVPAVCEGQTTGASQATVAVSVPTGNLIVARSGHTATLLKDGRVLVVGGADDNSSELYDPVRGTWSLTGNTHVTRRWGHIATLLLDGRVLVAGGRNNPTVEIYDPTSGMWTITGSLNTARWDHTATLLQDGKVLIAGGRPGYWHATSGTEMYDPATGTWTLAALLGTARYGHSATVLPNGQVIVLGGWQDDLENPLYFRSCERYNPVAGSWNSCGMLATAKRYHSATLLPGGKILILGGLDATSYTPTQLSNLFDPGSGKSFYAADLQQPRFRPTATLIPGRGVLVTGGAEMIATAEILDLDGKSSRVAGGLVTARYGHTATLLRDGKVLIAGGSRFTQDGNEEPLGSAEVYDDFPLGTISPAFTGSWYDPAQSGQGLFVEVLPDSRFFAGWFTFNPAGTEQAWFVGVGTYSGNTATINAVEQATGGRWIPNFDPARVTHNAWGRLTFTFTDCNHGKVDFNSTAGYGSGSMNLTRLTQPVGLAC